MKNYLLVAVVLITSICNAEYKVKIYYEQIGRGYNIYANNDEFCPVSIEIDFTVINLSVKGGNNKTYTADSQSKKQLLTTLYISDKQKEYKFFYKYRVNLGDHLNNEYDANYNYDLPFNTSNQFKVVQGYNGTFSHQNQNSLDFKMPVGTEITAVREGIVIDVIEHNNKNCEKEECEKYNNYITIYHPDGTFAQYAHIQQNGSEVKVGDKVVKGQLIGFSGNVGWSTGPHLHLVIFKQKMNERQTLKTKFRTGDGTNAEFLTEKEEYSRTY